MIAAAPECASSSFRLTLQAVGVEQVLAFFVAFDAAFGTANTLASDAPQKTFAFVAIGRRRGRPRLEVVRSRARDWINQTLQCFLVDVHFL